MLVEIEGHTVPHFKAPVNAKMELWGLECGTTFSIQTSLLNISHLLHKTGFVATEVGTTVTPKECLFHGNYTKVHVTKNIKRARLFYLKFFPTNFP